MKHIIAMWCLWAALDIFSYVIFMVYLKCAHKFAITKNKSLISELFFFCSTILAACFRVFTDLRYICVIHVWIQLDVNNSNM